MPDPKRERYDKKTRVDRVLGERRERRESRERRERRDRFDDRAERRGYTADDIAVETRLVGAVGRRADVLTGELQSLTLEVLRLIRDACQRRDTWKVISVLITRFQSVIRARHVLAGDAYSTVAVVMHAAGASASDAVYEMIEKLGWSPSAGPSWALAAARAGNKSMLATVYDHGAPITPDVFVAAAQSGCVEVLVFLDGATRRDAVLTMHRDIVREITAAVTCGNERVVAHLATTRRSACSTEISPSDAYAIAAAAADSYNSSLLPMLVRHSIVDVRVAVAAALAANNAHGLNCIFEADPEAVRYVDFTRLRRTTPTTLRFIVRAARATAPDLAQTIAHALLERGPDVPPISAGAVCEVVDAQWPIFFDIDDGGNIVTTASGIGPCNFDTAQLDALLSICGTSLRDTIDAWSQRVKFSTHIVLAYTKGRRDRIKIAVLLGNGGVITTLARQYRVMPTIDDMNMALAAGDVYVIHSIMYAFKGGYPPAVMEAVFGTAAARPQDAMRILHCCAEDKVAPDNDALELVLADTPEAASFREIYDMKSALTIAHNHKDHARVSALMKVVAASYPLSDTLPQP